MMTWLKNADKRAPKTGQKHAGYGQVSAINTSNVTSMRRFQREGKSVEEVIVPNSETTAGLCEHTR